MEEKHSAMIAAWRYYSRNMGAPLHEHHNGGKITLSLGSNMKCGDSTRQGAYDQLSVMIWNEMFPRMQVQPNQHTAVNPMFEDTRMQEGDEQFSELRNINEENVIMFIKQQSHFDKGVDLHMLYAEFTCINNPPRRKTLNRLLNKLAFTDRKISKVERPNKQTPLYFAA